MSPLDRTKHIVEAVANSEKAKYSIDFKVETPTVIQYYIDNIKKHAFTLNKSGIANIVNGVRAGGLADLDSILIMNRNHYFNWAKKDIFGFLKNKDKYPIQDVGISETTLHEIRHVLQQKRRDLFSNYELFNIHYLSDMNSLKYYATSEYHDSLYNEIDADLYMSQEGYKMFKDNEMAKTYFNMQIGKNIWRKNSYNFDFFFDRLCANISKNGFQDNTYANEGIFNRFWNENGTFKRPSEIMSAISIKPKDELYTRITTSNAYLSSMNMYELESWEVDWLNDQIDKNNELIERNKRVNMELLRDHLITEDMYNNALNSFESTIANKESYRNILNGKNYSNGVVR